MDTSNSLSVLVLGLLMSSAACMPPAVRATLPELQTRAAFDLACPQNWLRLHHFGARAKGVSGCGRQLSYVEACELFDGERICSWEADGPVNAITAPAPEAAGIPTAPSLPPSPGATPTSQPAGVFDPLGDRY